MRLILILLMTLSLSAADAQKNIKVTAQNKTVKVNLLDEDPEKVLSINAKTVKASSKLTVVNSDYKNEKEWKRSFSIYNDKDQEIVDLKPCKTGGNYQIALKDIVSKMTKGETYSLYTMAIPKDPKKAAVVRVRRVFVCRISIT